MRPKGMSVPNSAGYVFFSFEQNVFRFTFVHSLLNILREYSVTFLGYIYCALILLKVLLISISSEKQSGVNIEKENHKKKRDGNP